MNKLSLLRSLFHISGAAIPLSYLFWGRTAALVLTLSLFVILVASDILRIAGYLDAAFVTKHLKTEEMKRPTGSLFYMLGCLITILVFGKYEATASILVLAISDPASSIIGRTWGRRPLFLGKSLEGTGAFFFSALLLLAFFRFSLPAVIGSACAATAAELFSARLIDDNLSIPLVTGGALSVFSVWQF
jgi:dolichol kinase